MEEDNSFTVETITSFFDVESAEIHKALLESAGVQCALWHAQSAMLVPFSGPASVDLVVRSEDKDRAIEILSAAFDQTEVDTNEQDSK